MSVSLIQTNSPKASEPKGLLKGSFTEELESLSPVFLFESELPPDGLNGSELKKLSPELWNRKKVEVSNHRLN